MAATQVVDHCSCGLRFRAYQSDPFLVNVGKKMFTAKGDFWYWCVSCDAVPAGS